jgi:hypothetical protein
VAGSLPPDGGDDPEATLAAMLAQHESRALTPSPPSDEARAPAPEPRPPLEAIVDRALLALVAGRPRPEIVREHGLVTFAREPRQHLDPADWGAGFLAVHEGGPPRDIREAMAEQTPQAHLRDLYRPVYSEAPVPLELNEMPLDPGGRAAYAAVRAALVREPLPQVVRSLELVAERRDAWRAFLAAPWQPFLRDDEPRREVLVAIEPSLTG